MKVNMCHVWGFLCLVVVGFFLSISNCLLLYCEVSLKLFLKVRKIQLSLPC